MHTGHTEARQLQQAGGAASWVSSLVKVCTNSMTKGLCGGALKMANKYWCVRAMS